jgi:hypothetical protein
MGKLKKSEDAERKTFVLLNQSTLAKKESRIPSSGARSDIGNGKE